MLISTFNYKTLLLSSALILASSCGDDDDDDSGVAATPVSIPFSAMLGDEPAACDTTFTVGSSQTEVAMEDFRFYVSDIVLLDEQGMEYPVTLNENDFQQGTVALLDFQNKADKCSGDEKATNDSVEGTVGISLDLVRSIKFTIGLPADINHADPSTATTPLNIGSMQWNWKAGYKFAKIDLAPVGGLSTPNAETATASSFLFHLGSGDCDGDPAVGEDVSCDRGNRPVVSLEDFNPATKKVVLNFGAALENVAVDTDAGGAPGCMSGKTDPECSEIIPAFGLELDSGAVSTASARTVFPLQDQ